VGDETPKGQVGEVWGVGTHPSPTMVSEGAMHPPKKILEFYP